jgi:hypothetical protein
MTHTLHRFGNLENLSDDYVVFAMSAKGINEKGSAGALKEFMRLAFALEPINAGDMKTGNVLTHSQQAILDGIQDVSIVHAVFTEEEKVVALLERVKEADLGISVVVSGLFDRVKAISKEAGLKQHTVECSSGVWGRTEKLPDASVMQITTMCGHGMVAASLVEHYAKLVRSKKVTAEQAGIEIARPCVCGVFNPVRAARLIQAAANATEKVTVGSGQTMAPALSSTGSND